MDDVYEVLQERGFVYQVSDEAALCKRLEAPITLYNGIDATADSLTVGHLMPIMMLAHFQRCGHRPIALVGGGTTMIGDPSGRTSSRPILTEEDIDANVAGIKAQLSRLLDFSDDRALLLNNKEWLKPLAFMDFMRTIGTRFSVNEILRLEAYRTRLDAGGLTFLELCYVLMQSYDFLRLYEDHDCVLQVGGSDQWGNSISGADLIRRMTGGEAFVLVHPLLATASGAKMGKSEKGAVWLSADRTSPYDYYQYWRNTDDRDVASRLAIFTFLPMDEVRRLGSLEGVELNQAKEVLAFEATRLLHGDEAAEKAQAAARSLFAGDGQTGEVPTVEVERARLQTGMAVTELFKEAGLVSSANEARSLITQGGLSINGEAVQDARARIDLSGMPDDQLTLSRGRKRHMRVVVR
jgi:tyrosyl-tRNA synthetase